MHWRALHPRYISRFSQPQVWALTMVSNTWPGLCNLRDAHFFGAPTAVISRGPRVSFTAYSGELCPPVQSTQPIREGTLLGHRNVPHQASAWVTSKNEVRATKRRAPERWMSQLGAGRALERRRGLFRTREGQAAPTWVKLCPITERSC